MTGINRRIRHRGPVHRPLSEYNVRLMLGRLKRVRDELELDANRLGSSGFHAEAAILEDCVKLMNGLWSEEKAK